MGCKMWCKKCNFLFLISILVIIFLFFGSVSAEWIDCWDYGPYGFSGNTVAECLAAGCLATSSSGTVIAEYLGGGVTNDNVSIDAWCWSNMPYCCLGLECWQYDGTNESWCEENSAGLDCTWDPFMELYYPNGSLANVGGCMTNWSGTGGKIGGEFKIVVGNMMGIRINVQAEKILRDVLGRQMIKIKILGAE